jgi:hypothetical protein
MSAKNHLDYLKIVQYVSGQHQKSQNLEDSSIFQKSSIADSQNMTQLIDTIMLKVQKDIWG